MAVSACGVFKWCSGQEVLVSAWCLFEMHKANMAGDSEMAVLR